MDEALQIARLRRMCEDGTAGRIRRAARMTRAEIGQALDVSHTAVYLWETGRQVPRREHALKYVELLDALAKIVGDMPAPTAA